jgi:hypothetical protein
MLNAYVDPRPSEMIWVDSSAFIRECLTRAWGRLLVEDLTHKWTELGRILGDTYHSVPLCLLHIPAAVEHVVHALVEHLYRPCRVLSTTGLAWVARNGRNSRRVVEYSPSVYCAKVIECRFSGSVAGVANSQCTMNVRTEEDGERLDEEQAAEPRWAVAEAMTDG